MKNYAIIAILCLVSQTIFAQKDRPNILGLTFEDTSPQFIGCYGNKAAKTSASMLLYVLGKEPFKSSDE